MSDVVVVKEKEVEIVKIEPPGSGGALLSGGMGVIVHGSVASTPRGINFAQYIWIGTVEPTHMDAHDLWVEG